MEKLVTWLYTFLKIQQMILLENAIFIMNFTYTYVETAMMLPFLIWK